MPLLWNRFSATSQTNVQCNEYPRNAQHEHYLPYPCMFCGYYPWWFGDFIFTQGIYMAMEHEFQRFNFPHIPAICITFVHAGGIVISDTQPPIFFCTLNWYWCPRISDALEVLHFPRTFTRASGLLFADIPHISRTCITLIWDISALQLPGLFVHISMMLWTFRIFPGHLPEHQGCVFQRFQTLPGHLLHVVYLFQILRTISIPFSCAHSPDAPEVPHCFQDIDLSTRAVSFGYSGHSQDMYYSWHIYFGYLRH